MTRVTNAGSDGVALVSLPLLPSDPKMSTGPLELKLLVFGWDGSIRSTATIAQADIEARPFATASVVGDSQGYDVFFDVGSPTDKDAIDLLYGRYDVYGNVVRAAAKVATLTVFKSLDLSHVPDLGPPTNTADMGLGVGDGRSLNSGYDDGPSLRRGHGLYKLVPSKWLLQRPGNTTGMTTVGSNFRLQEVVVCDPDTAARRNREEDPARAGGRRPLSSDRLLGQAAGGEPAALRKLADLIGSQVQ